MSKLGKITGIEGDIELAHCHCCRKYVGWIDEDIKVANSMCVFCMEHGSHMTCDAEVAAIRTKCREEHPELFLSAEATEAFRNWMIEWREMLLEAMKK